jgi:adenine-specific DNA-methyltransferase
MVELIWDGKYDANGKRTAPLRLKLPFQTVETVNASAQQRQMALDMFSAGRPTEWRNRLIWGDKKYVLPALLDEFAGRVDLIYIDPPFNVGADFSLRFSVEDENFTKEASMIEQKAYRDTWGQGLHSYLHWFTDTILFLSELLAQTGVIYVHLDHHVSHYAKIVMDEIFGSDNFQNELIWLRTTGHSDSNKWNHSHDVILFYSKSQKFLFKPLFQPYTEEHITSSFRYIEEETGRQFSAGDLMAGGTRKGESGKPWRGIDPTERNGHWQYPVSELDELDKQGRIYWPPAGRIPRLKRYLDDMPGRPVKSIWDDISPVQGNSKERTGYDTQKPEALLERIITASTDEGNLVFDCFCGSGTTAAVAEKLNRRWIACDLGRFAIHTTRKRLLSVPNVKPFVVQNLGKYERQAWQVAEFGSEENAAVIVHQYRRFILDLYHARSVEGYIWLHGIKEGRMVHVGPVDAPISPNDIKQIAIEFRKAVGTGKDAPNQATVDVLGWDFAFELNEVARQQAAQANINMRFLRIPREVLEQKAVEQGDIKFFELAALAVDFKQIAREVTLQLTDFVIPPDDVPEDVQRAISNWSQWIDYWAVDWDNKGDTFHNMWQTYRTRQDKSLKLHTTHRYDQAGEYNVMIKVIDILGNDTTKTLQIKLS